MSATLPTCDGCGWPLERAHLCSCNIFGKDQLFCKETCHRMAHPIHYFPNVILANEVQI